MRRKRPLDRSTEILRDSPLIVIASEDTHAVRQYFDFFRSTRIQFRILQTDDGKSAPQHVLARLDEYRREFEIGDRDELWLVSDCDHWIKPGHIANLVGVLQECQQKGINVALSHPCFEMWLLLHFADFPASEAVSCDEIAALIRDAVGFFDKAKVYRLPIDDAKVSDAVERATTRGCDPGDLPTTPATAVHAIIADLLAKKIICVAGA